MGFDTDRLRIISMNANGRNGKQFMDFSSSKLDDIIGQNQPDVLLLPGDEKYKLESFTNYRTITEQSRGETVLLYNCNRIRQNEQFSKQTPAIQHFRNLVFPAFQVMAPPPTQTVVKEFHCLTWHFEAMLTSSDNRYKIGADFMMFGQFLAMFSGMQIFIGGDFNLPLSKMEELLKEHNRIIAQGNDQVKPFFRQFGYMDEMTDNVMRPQRRLRQMRLVQCGNAAKTEFNHPDFYVASKEMELHGTKTLNINCKSGKSVEVTTKNPYIAPSMTEMRIPARPPKHSGG